MHSQKKESLRQIAHLLCALWIPHSTAQPSSLLSPHRSSSPSPRAARRLAIYLRPASRRSPLLFPNPSCEPSFCLVRRRLRPPCHRELESGQQSLAGTKDRGELDPSDRPISQLDPNRHVLDSLDPRRCYRESGNQRNV
ncbi:hypothetical protein Droror1_Dr00024872 [Drosera rotundifolia]